MRRLYWRSVVAFVAAALLASTGMAASAPHKKKHSHPAATAGRKSAPKKTANRRPRRTLTAHAAPRAQTAPTPQRYKEIQQALEQKGYLHGEPNGVWNQESVDALRRFQHDQNLEASGKLDSLSLIALGLGPKH